MNVDNPNLSRTESLANNTTPSINSLVDNTTGYTEAEFTTNSWGYHLSGDTNYFAIPTTQLQLSTSTEPVNANSTTITFASKVDMNQPAGTYTTNMTLYAITNTPIPTMQDIDNWRGSLAENQSIRTIGSRDGKYYWVLKAKDGNIWMTQNLDLDIDSNKTYTPQDTDLTSDWTPIRSTIPKENITSAGVINGWENDANTPYSFDVGDWYWNNVWYDSNICGGNDYRLCNYLAGTPNGKFSKTPYSSNGTHGHVGNYYNYSAAVAMNDTSSYTTSTYDNPDNSPQTSICPAGWRLPTISSIASKNEFNSLFTAYNGDTTNDRVPIATPLFFVRGGLSYSKTLYSAGYNGHYWSSTIYSNIYSYVSIFAYNIINSMANNGNRTYGRSVRCLARSVATVTFNANSGEGTMPPQKIDERGATLATNTFTRDGYVFTGWNTKADGTGTPYANGATLRTYTDEDITLYAQWREYNNIAELTYMQDFAKLSSSALASVKNSMSANTAYQLKDIRDNKTYRITKINNIVWMTSNLNIAGGTTLTPTTSNVTRNFTLPASSTSGFSSNSGAYVYNHSSYGGYYSFTAVTAGTNPSSGNASQDVCPTGWKLPTSSNFTTLKNAYATGNAIITSPWYGNNAGLFNGGTYLFAGQYGYYWSSTAVDSNNAYHLYFTPDNTGVGPTTKDYGFPVRCIAK